MTDPLPDPGRRKDKDDLHDQARREASANSAQTPGADYLTDENGNTTAILAAHAIGFRVKAGAYWSLRPRTACSRPR